jgi:hypothetical protein
LITYYYLSDCLFELSKKYFREGIFKKSLIYLIKSKDSILHYFNNENNFETKSILKLIFDIYNHFNYFNQDLINFIITTTTNENNLFFKKLDFIMEGFFFILNNLK